MPNPKSGESGYALLLVVFLAATMILAATAILPNLLTQGRREREEELIWRGQQYARAVRLYYRKNGRFPQSLEDLAQAKNQIHFLRKAYTDPMNRQDGSWRVIYVGPSGELIGSVRRTALLQLPAAQRPPGAVPAAQTGGSTEGSSRTPVPDTLPGMTPPIEPGSQQPSPPAPRQPAPSASSPTEGAGRVFGGNIIGVGSKVARASLRVYEGGTTYREWEFIWDPTKDAVVVGQPAVAPGGPTPGKPPGGPPQGPGTAPRPPQ